MLRRLDRDVVGNPGCRIGPEIGRDLFRGAEADVDIIGDGLRVETELQRPRPIDVHHEGRRIELLLKMGVGDARNARDAAPQLMRHAQIVGAIATDDPNVDLRRQSEIEDLGDHVGGLEIEGHRRKGGRQHLAEPAHVVGGRRVPLLERDQDHAVVDVDGRAVGESEVVRPLRHADVVDDEVAVARRNDLADLVLDLLEDALGRFDAGRRRRADVELDLSAVDGGEEVAADHGEHHAAQREHQRGGNRDDEPPLEQHREHAHIALAKPLEAALESAGENAQTSCPSHRSRRGARP